MGGDSSVSAAITAPTRASTKGMGLQAECTSNLSAGLMTAAQARSFEITEMMNSARREGDLLVSSRRQARTPRPLAALTRRTAQPTPGAISHGELRSLLATQTRLSGDPASEVARHSSLTWQSKHRYNGVRLSTEAPTLPW